jgi:isochorismate synthase EntC
MQAANILVMMSKQFSGGVTCMRQAKEVVEEHVRWLEPKRLKKCFNWEQDMTKNMFVLAVIKDSGNAQQHAVTLFRDWIFDSNEPFALPLNKHNLNMCTWDVKDGNIIEDSLFVNFCGRWIFQEPEEKKKKILDNCVL